jgi:ribosome modulation factor
MTTLYEAFHEGIQARQQGLPALSNPYDENNKSLRNAWINGWMTEDRAMRTGEDKP